MTPCKASDLSISAVGGPGIPIPGFGPPFSPIQTPLDDLDLPTDLVEDIIGLMQRLQALFPSGIFKANADSVMKNVLDFIANILSQIAPFLSFYNFIMALLNIIICIIEVLCAIPDPIAIAFKLKKLFTECLPPFLLLFPFLALIAMILSLLLLILALLEYLLTTILGIIAQIIQNIIILQKGLTLQDAESTLTAAQKIASLLCLIEGLFAFFIAIAAIIAIIQALSQFAGGAICSGEDEEGCCSPEICPAFIRDNKEILVTNGQLIYYNKLGADLSGASGLPSTLVGLLGNSIVLRSERWQLIDTNINSQTPINLIITKTTDVNFGGRIFYPDQEFEADTPPNRAPYTVDLTLELDPSIFISDSGGSRTFQIKDCIVVRKPRNGVLSFNNSTVTSGTGTFDLEGGLVFEEDGITPVNVNGIQATLNTFIHMVDEVATNLPSIEDGYFINNVEFKWKPNHQALAGFGLISVGCFPEISIEKAVQNAFIETEGVGSILSRIPNIGILSDDILNAQRCAQNAVNKFRSGLNTETAAIFQTEIESCINDLSQKVSNLFCESFIEAVSIFKSTFSIDTDVQFTTRFITVSVILRDGGGTNISSNLPNNCLEDILDKLKGNVTFGKISDFIYNSVDSIFEAQITSDSGGTGELTVTWDGQLFSEVIEGLSFDIPSSIEEKIVNYTFVDAAAEPGIRRGPEDVSNHGGGN